MRPVARGDAPNSYQVYGDAIDDLVLRLGPYCSYCERRMPASLAVEHIVPKSKHPDLELSWSNFLLGCVNCNSVKADKDPPVDGLLWPDQHNTLLAFRYRKGGFVEVSEDLLPSDRAGALRLLELVGLDRHAAPGYPSPARRDKRWVQREEMWTMALLRRSKYEQQARPTETIEDIVEIAKGYGFFSVWYAVFSGYPEVRKALREAHPGTAEVFDDDGNPLPRSSSGV